MNNAGIGGVASLLCFLLSGEASFITGGYHLVDDVHAAV